MARSSRSSLQDALSEKATDLLCELTKTPCSEGDIQDILQRYSEVTNGEVQRILHELLMKPDCAETVLIVASIRGWQKMRLRAARALMKSPYTSAPLLEELKQNFGP